MESEAAGTARFSGGPQFCAAELALNARLPGASPAEMESQVSQPIEDRTNEIISGSRADVAIQIYGPELHVLANLANQVRDAVRAVPGIGDYRVERLLGQPSLSAVVDRKRMASYGVRVEDALAALTATPPLGGESMVNATWVIPSALASKVFKISVRS